MSYKKIMIGIGIIFMFLITMYSALSASCVGTNFNFTCGETINESCSLNANLESNGSSCFYSSIDNITIDLAGFNITSDRTNFTVGINATGNNLTIKNGFLNGFYAGIFASVNNSLMDNLSFQDNLRNAIYSENGINNSYYNLWINNTWADETYEAGSHCIYDNPRGESGLSVCVSENTIVENYTMYGRDLGGDQEKGTDSGLDIFASPNSILNNIELHYPDTYGIMIYDFGGVPSDGTNVTGYRLYGAKSDGKSTNDMIISGADNLTLINLYGENTTELGAFINNAENTYINNYTMIGANGVGLRLTTASWNAQVYNSNITNCGWGFYLPSATNITIVNSTITNGVAFESDLLNDFTLDCARDNINIIGGSSNNLEIMSGSNVTIRNCNLSNDGSYENIYIENNGYNISNNTISNGKYGIEVGAYSIGTISNNLINTHEDGIYFDNGFIGEITIENNIISGATHGGITTENLLTNLTFSKNNISNSLYGIYFDDMPLIYGYPQHYINILDSDFSSNTYNGYANENGTLYFLNTTLDNDNFEAIDTSIIYVKHYLDIYVNDTNSNPVENASVLVYASSPISQTSTEHFNSDYYTYETNPYADIGGGTWEIINNQLNGFMGDADIAMAYYNNDTYYSSTYKQVRTNFSISSASPSGWQSVIASIDLQPDNSYRNYGCWEQLYGGVWYLGIYSCFTYGCVSYNTIATDAGNSLSYDTEYEMIFTRNGSDFTCEIPDVSSISGSDSTWFGGYEGLGVFTSNVTYDNTNITYNYYTYLNDYLYLNLTTNSTGNTERQNATEYYVNATGTYYYTNYTINATNTTYNSNSKQLNLTTNVFDFFLTLNNNITISNVAITPNPAYPSTFLNCTGTYSSSYGYAESGSVYQWFKNSVVISGETSKILNIGNYGNGDIMVCEYTPSDGISFGLPVNSSAITIQTITPTTGAGTGFIDCGINKTWDGNNCVLINETIIYISNNATLQNISIEKISENLIEKIKSSASDIIESAKAKTKNNQLKYILFAGTILFLLIILFYIFVERKKVQHE